MSEEIATRLIMKFYNMLWEFRLGINSRGTFDSSIHKETHFYSTVSYYSTLQILKNLSIGANDVFFDIGCGKGRVLCCASILNYKKVVGIELNKELSGIAQKNLGKMKKRKVPFEVINASATDCDYTEGTIFYLFNPFGESTLKEVISKIEKTMESNPREIKIAYVRPNYDSVIEQSGWLKKSDSWLEGSRFGLMHDVSFWVRKGD